MRVHMFGVVRAQAGGLWTLLDNSTHTPEGLLPPQCVGTELYIPFVAPLSAVGTVSITMDEAYAGKVFAGPSVALSGIYLTFRINGSVVSCNSAALVINNSNIFIDAWGDQEPAP